MDKADGYGGVENLEAMTHAKNYNDFLIGLIDRYATGFKVLDFGAGAGTFAVPAASLGREVVCVEPDVDLRARLRDLGVRVHQDLSSVPEGSFDSAYSFNVLEHIEDDQTALYDLGARIKPGGSLVLYVPAFQVLYSAMDRRVGHFRRYRKTRLQRQLIAAGFAIELGRYVDSLGFLVTLMYKVIGNRSGVVSARSVAAYDRFVFPLSRVIDGVCGRFFGKNVLVVARKT